MLLLSTVHAYKCCEAIALQRRAIIVAVAHPNEVQVRVAKNKTELLDCSQGETCPGRKQSRQAFEMAQERKLNVATIMHINA